MSLHTLVEQSADTDLLPKMIDFAVERPVELEVRALTGAENG